MAAEVSRIQYSNINLMYLCALGGGYRVFLQVLNNSYVLAAPILKMIRTTRSSVIVVFICPFYTWNFEQFLTYLLVARTQK